MKFSKKIILIAISLLSVSGFFLNPIYAKDNFTLDIRQSVNLPGGKAAGDDSTATIPYEKSTNGEVDLAYSITVPKTKKSKWYRLCILLPADINPTVSSMDVQGTVREYFDLEKDYEKYFSTLDKRSVDNMMRYFVLRELFLKYNITSENISKYYVCLIDLNSSKDQNISKIEFTITIPESYKDGIVNSKMSNYVYTGIFEKPIGLPPKLFALKIR